MSTRAAFLLLAAALVLPLPALSQEIARPKARPTTLASSAPVAPQTADSGAIKSGSAAVSPTLRPKPRPPARPAAPETAPDARSQNVAATGGMTRSPRPMPRPKELLLATAALNAAPQDAGQAANPDPAKPNLLQLLFGAGGAQKVPKGSEGAAASAEQLASAAPAPRAPQQTAPRKGSVCGDRAIRGEKIKPITSKVAGCGVEDAVSVTEVSGIRLTQAVTVECGTVTALKEWIDTEMRPAFGQRDVAKLRIAAHYACRRRNNKRNARISEHGKGKALDISGFIFTDGTEWTIQRDYNKQIRKAHKGACGIFGTTLGPGSDGFHEDHLHFDTASYRSGSYCR